MDTTIPSPSKKKKKKKKKKTKKKTNIIEIQNVKERQEKHVAEAFTFYARFEEIVEDYKIQSDIGERILSQLSSMLPSIDNVNNEFSSNSNPNRTDDYNNNDMYLNYSPLANNIEDLFSIFSKCINNLKIYLVEMEDVIKENNESLKQLSTNKHDIEHMLLYRGESNCKCSPSDWHTIIMAEYGMIKQDIKMKCNIYNQIVNNKMTKQNELILLTIKWKTKPFINNHVLKEANDLIKVDHVVVS